MSAFTIRVYGIVEHDDRILLSREKIQGDLYVKFPGGGLEYGEGTRTCLQRELSEEIGVDSAIGAHFYTTDYFQPSTFHNKPTQVISVYYRATLLQPIPPGILVSDEGEPGFFWISVSSLHADMVDLPIDKKVIEMLCD